MGVLTHCHFISRLILKYSKNLHLNRAIKAEEKIPVAFSKFWTEQHTNSFHVWEWCCPLLGNHNSRKLCSSESQQIQAKAAYIFLTPESLPLAGDLGLLYPKEEIGVLCWPLFVSAEEGGSSSPHLFVQYGPLISSTKLAPSNFSKVIWKICRKVKQKEIMKMKDSMFHDSQVLSTRWKEKAIPQIHSALKTSRHQ